jgi:hypothetical protein
MRRLTQRQRRGEYRAAKQRDELAAFHCQCPFYVQHGGLPPLCLLAPRPARSAGLPHAQTVAHGERLDGHVELRLRQPP